MPARVLRLIVLPKRYAVCRLSLDSELQMWFLSDAFFAMVRSNDQLTIVCEESKVPTEVEREGAWRALKIDGVFGFNETGILQSVLKPLAEANIGVFALSTFETDVVLVKAERSEEARVTLERTGHIVEG